MVYVYETSIRGTGSEFVLRRKLAQKEEDLRSRSRFGACLAHIGDLDGDGYQDFAIGAPYEDHGAVYVYRGHEHFEIDGEMANGEKMIDCELKN